MKTIEVVPNPYIGLDKDGIPQAVVGAGMPGTFIGAQADLVASQQTGKNRFYYPLDRDGKMTKKVVFSGEIVASVQAGELLAANPKDALACGITAKEYLEPEKALAAEKAKANARWQALHATVDGKPDTTKQVGDIPREATRREENETGPAASAPKQLTPTVKLTKNTEA